VFVPPPESVAGGDAGGGAAAGGGACGVGVEEDGVPTEQGTGISSNTRQTFVGGSSPPPQPANDARTANKTTCKTIFVRVFVFFISNLPFADLWAALNAQMIILCNGSRKYLKVKR